MHPPIAGFDRTPIVCTLAAMLLPSHYGSIIERALEEDLGAGDLTTEATVEPTTQATATAVARLPLVACGRDVFFAVFQRVDPSIECTAMIEEGTFAQRGAHLWRVRGRATTILMAERVALNFVQRMSGIATLTRSFVEQLPAGCRTRITDTRKTTPGMRALERYAVRTGGGHNHRDNLGSAVLIKDNHIVAAGGIGSAVQRARIRAPHTSRIEVEVATLVELDQALEAQADVIMLDNFEDHAIAEAVSIIGGRATTEVSGRVSIDRISVLAQLGVDVISIGALTHSSPSADIALDLESAP